MRPAGEKALGQVAQGKEEPDEIGSEEQEHDSGPWPGRTIELAPLDRAQMGKAPGLGPPLQAITPVPQVTVFRSPKMASRLDLPVVAGR
jgi:hypothetical protein